MRSLNILICFLLGLSPNLVRGQQDTFSIRATFDQQLSTQNLILEMDLLRDWVGRKAYNLPGFIFSSRDSFDLKVKNLRELLLNRDSISFIEYADQIMPLMHFVKDDHAFFPLLSWGIKEPLKPGISLEKVVIPLELVVFQNRCYVVKSLDIPPKSEVLAINDIPMLEVVTKVVAYYNFNSLYYLQKHGYAEFNCFRFSAILFHLFGFENEVKITYRTAENTPAQDQTLPLYSFRQTLENDKAEGRPQEEIFDLRFVNKTAILTLNSFRERDKGLSEFIDFYNKAFKEIEQQGSENLLIDISHNRGGQNRTWIILLNYLYAGNLKFRYDKPAMELAELSGIILDRKKKKKALKVLNLQPRFKGQVHLLIGPKTFSAAVNLADNLQYNKLATLWGVETSGWATHYGQLKESILPYSQLKIFFSGRLFYNLEGSGKIGGIIPEHELAFDTITQFWKYYLDQNWADELAEKL